MSLMNDMLRDLDKRQAPDRSQQVEAQGYGALIQKAPSHGSQTLLILLGVLIVILLLLTMAWWYLQARVQDIVPESGNVQRIVESTAEVGISLEKPEPKPVVVVARPVIKSIVKAETKPLDLEKDEPATEPIVHVPEVPQVKPKAKPVQKAKPKKKISKLVVLSPGQKDEKAASLAMKMLQSGDAEKASSYLYQFIDQHKVDEQSRAVLVSQLISNHQMTEADHLLNSTDISQSSHLRRLRAHWFSANNQLDEAIVVLNSSIPNVEADVEYHVLLAALYQQQGYGTEAVARYAELIRYKPDVPSWWVGMAIGLDRSEQYPSAVKAYQKALQMGGLRTELVAFAKQRLATLSE